MSHRGRGSNKSNEVQGVPLRAEGSNLFLICHTSQIRARCNCYVAADRSRRRRHHSTLQDMTERLLK